MEPKVNEVWVAWVGGVGSLCLIVSSPESLNAKIAMLWFNETSKEFSVSPIYARLIKKTTLTPKEFFSAVDTYL